MDDSLDPSRSTVKVALLSVDPIGLTTFHAFDPDSFSVISAINDALVYVDNDGAVRPALATSWRRISSRETEFTLRESVRFSNGEPFDADSVVATFRAHREPTLSAGGRGVLGPVVDVARVDARRVVVRTAFPDAMLLRRMFFSSIYPRGVLEREGRDALAAAPVGTGPFRLASYTRGRELVLDRVEGHWSGGAAAARLRLPILRQKEWVDRLARAEIDVALGLDCHDRIRASRAPALRVASRESATSQWFLLSQRGPLADAAVRRALQHAVHRRALVDVAAHGFGAPQHTVATPEQEGYTPCEPYRYSPELARRMLAEAGYPRGFTLRGLVSETSTSVFAMVREFLAQVGVTLDGEVVPRGVWLGRVVGGNLRGEPYDGDFALAHVDNPILHSLFHHFIFLFSRGPFSLIRDADYDREFHHAAAYDGEDPAGALARLERYARDQALVLFTLREHVHAAWREGYGCDLPRSGHFQVASLVTLRAASDVVAPRTLPPSCVEPADAAALLEATGYTGAFYLAPGARLEHPLAQRVWQNLAATEARWRVECEPMARQLVRNAEAQVHLANVLCSSTRVALAGYDLEGRRLYVNRGWVELFGDDGRGPVEHLGARWRELREAVDRDGAWSGTVHFTSAGRPEGAPDRLHVAVTHATDRDGAVVGHAFVLQDFSGEEERIRGHAIRTILRHVPYGLLLCDREGRVREGYSDACARAFDVEGGGAVGRELPALLGMSPRGAAHFRAAYQQLVDDVLPEAVSLGNLPARVEARGRVWSLSAEAVRDAGAIESVLVTLVDVSDLQSAEQEVESLRSVLHVMRHRETFERFARDLHQSLGALASAGPGEGREVEWRRALHTAKGVFAQFGLRDLAGLVHDTEDEAQLGAEHLRAVDRALGDRVARHRDVWGIALEGGEARYSIGESQLAAIEARLRAVERTDAVAEALACVAQVRARTVADLIGPVDESCRLHAERVGKRVRLVVVGGDVRCPPAATEVFTVLPHLLRNAIDHGVEAPEERGDKPSLATISLRVAANDDGLRIEVGDDGRGVTEAQVVERALALGLVDDARLAALCEQERLSLVFAQGLSTSEQATETSGRGVGLAAVKATVERLGGSIRVESTPGHGTRFEIRVRAGCDARATCADAGRGCPGARGRCG